MTSYDPNFEDFRSRYEEKLQMLRRRPATQTNWALIGSIVIGILLWAGFVYGYYLVYPNTPLTLTVVLLSLYFTFLMYFAVYSFFGIYHMYRFGFQGDLSVLSIVLYMVLAAAVVYGSLVLIF